MYSHLEPVVLTSNDSSLAETFTGYAFSGAHLIIGRAGHEDWLAGGRRALMPHQDGCYMVASRHPSGLEVGADFKGYCKLYIYRNGNDWGVSNSFNQLVQKAKQEGWPITPNEGVLASWSFPGAFWQQFTTFSTAANEITVLPRQHKVHISNTRTLRTVPGEPVERDPDPHAYRVALGQFLQTWVGRFGTCLRQSDTRLLTELTGGLDSRVTIALLLAVRQYFPTDFGKQLSVRSSTAFPDDLAVAKAISDVYRLRLNRRPSVSPLGNDKINRVARWRDFALGSYGLIYWPTASSARGNFTVGGHGGEGHRSYWKYESPHAVLEKERAKFSSERVYRETLDSFDATRSLLDKEYPGIAPTVAHYREFRDRLHSGLHALHQIRLQPLSGSHMYRASDRLPDDALERGQMLYDVVAQTAPGLLAMPYDNERKVPSETVLQALAAPVALNPMRGEVFGLTAPPTEEAPQGDPWETAQELFVEAQRRLPNGLVPPEAISAGEEALKEVSANGKLKHPKFSRTIHQVILADLVTS